MKKLTQKTFLPAAGILILAASPCLSQTAVVPSPAAPQAATARKRMQEIRLRNVKPSVMAWWLDPKNNPQPTGATGSSSGIQGAPFVLPAGIDRIIAIDPQNALLVFGTEEGVRQLRDTVQFLDRPGDKIPLQFILSNQINVGVRLVTIQSDSLNGIWAALSSQTGRATPAVAFLKPEEELQLGEQIGRRGARFERIETRTLNSGTVWLLEFGPPLSTGSGRSFFKEFRSGMPVISPPETGEMRTFGERNIQRLLPSPLGDLRLQIKPTFQTNESVSLELRQSEPAGILGRADMARFEIRAGETLALALPASTPGTSAFLLFTARSAFQIGPLFRAPNRAPQLGDLPGIGELFKGPIAPRKAP